MKTIEGIRVRELRCRRCRAHIVHERIFAGYVVHTCPKCGYLNKFEFRFIDVQSVRDMINKKFVIKPKKGVNKIE